MICNKMGVHFHMAKNIQKSESQNRQFKGVFPAPPTPVTPDGRVNEPVFRALLEDNIAYGVDGFWIAGTTGEGLMLTDEQRIEVARIAGDVCSGRVLSIMHVGSVTTFSACEAASAAKKYGCDAVCSLPPLFWPQTENSCIENYRAISEASDGLPFFAYNLPQVTQVEISEGLMRKFLKEVPNMYGLKHSSSDFPNIRVFADMGLACFAGNGALPLPGLSMGAIGTIDAPLALAPWHYVALFNAWETGNIEGAIKLQNEVGAIVRLTRMFDAVPDVCKLILGKRLGVDCGRSIPPINQLTDAQKLLIISEADALGLISPSEPKIL